MPSFRMAGKFRQQSPEHRSGKRNSDEILFPHQHDGLFGISVRPRIMYLPTWKCNLAPKNRTLQALRQENFANALSFSRRLAQLSFIRLA
ncbi:hypothetical protein O181_026709 [Austropuccinia psidii MF-1]|uniref:Uncharacterized protein n=1 Tax=Austropuccinia psidii MF-1 TaxID=1389203 RepID=A0A9Q3CMS8_9BASI|nr:hypothetical protein [Austropuccinia psidii MF-1]